MKKGGACFTKELHKLDMSFMYMDFLFPSCWTVTGQILIVSYLGIMTYLRLCYAGWSKCRKAGVEDGDSKYSQMNPHIRSFRDNRAKSVIPLQDNRAVPEIPKALNP